ncbi:MAG: right-handed parallel beta-helix repeat-containing protein [Thermoplasmata archaeon]|nr:MAG: right-handed parallel beta-helix repeat-containing protein [Thermoplasmata archaeon]
MRRKIVRRFLSLMLCMVLFISAFVSLANVNVRAEEPEDPPTYPTPMEDEPSGPPEIEYSVYLSEVETRSESMFPEILFVNALADVSLSFNNRGQNQISAMIVEIYEIKYHYLVPDGGDLSDGPYTTTENHLTIIDCGEILPSDGKEVTFSWTPTDIGEHSIKLVINYLEDSVDIGYEEVLTFNVFRDDLPIIEISSDWIIDTDTEMDNVTIILEGDIVVNEGASLTLRDSYLRAGSLDIWGLVWFINVDFDVGCSNRGQYYIWVHKTPFQTGIFRLWGSTVFNNPPDKTYYFWVDGILECREWWIWYDWWPPLIGLRRSSIRNVWGQDFGGIETGGIELRNTDPSEQSSFRWTTVKECDTIGIGCYGSSPIIFPYCVLEYCGYILGPSPWGFGKGLYAEGSSANPTIQWSWVRHNRGIFNYGHGMKIKDGASATILTNNIYDNTYMGVFCYYSSSAVTINSNRIYDNTYGIYCYYSSATISFNIISSNSYGIICSRSGASISGNTISSSYYGILIYWTPSPSIEDNNFIISNTYYGIYMYSSSPSIENNEISSNGYVGIYMLYSSPTIEYNVIALNGYTWEDDYGGIYGYYSSPAIEDNEVISNDGWGIWMQYEAPVNAATIGTDNTYTPENVRGRVWQQWWMRVRTMAADGGHVAEAKVRIRDCWDTIVWEDYTAMNGYTPRITLTQYKIFNGQITKYYYTPHTAYAWKHTYAAVDTVTLDHNIDLVLTLGFKRYALLIAPVRAQWEDCLKVDIRDMRNYLLDRGYLEDRIIYLTTKNFPVEPNEWYIDGDATWQNVKDALDALESGGTYTFEHSDGTTNTQTFDASDADTMIFISMKDHGGQSRLDGSPGDPRPYDEATDDWDEAFCTYGNPSNIWDPAYFWYDDELDIEYDQIIYWRLIFEMMACHAGGFLPDCAGPMRLVVLSCQEAESSWGVPPYYDIYDGLVSAPTDYLVDDDFVSIEEAHQWEADTIPPGIPQNPISDDQIPGETFL